MQTVPGIEPLTPAAHERRAFFSYSGPMAGDAPALLAPRPGLLALEGGIVQHGTLRGAAVPAQGDLIFTTAATGWGEVLTDPSYAGQVVVLTHPMAGNYRIDAGELESAKVHARALVVSRLVTPPAGPGWSLEELLVAGEIPGGWIRRSPSCVSLPPRPSPAAPRSWASAWATSSWRWL